MRTVTVTLATTLVLILAAAAASAESGAGACVAGQGASVYTSFGAAYVGLNVGYDNSTTGLYTERAVYEAECCAEADQAPDCFRPAA